MLNRAPQVVAGVHEGDVIAGKYRIDRVLGRGGMGVVVAAQHVALDEKVALKFLLPASLEDPEAVARFVREARAAVKIKNEHVARVLDVGVLETGLPYIAMEYLEGGDLAEWLSQKGAMPVEQAVEFILQSCVALADTHALGIVHRDVKPANLFWVRRSDGQLSIKLLDFGISKMIARTVGPSVTIHATGRLMGSPVYMSPEQMQTSGRVDGRTDIWSLGVVLFELLAARPPFLANSLPELLLKIQRDPPPALRTFRPDVSEGLEGVILKCLGKEVSERYRNVGELARALLPFGPERAKASVERVSGIVHSANRFASAVDVSSSSRAIRAEASATSLPAVGSATTRASLGRTATIGLSLVGVLAVVAGAAFFRLAARTPTQPDGARLAVSSSQEPATLPGIPLVVAVATPGAAAPAESSKALEAKPADTGPGAATASALSTNPPEGKREASKPRKTMQPPPSAAMAPPTQSCAVATDYDNDGQPHFKKVCK
jgi:eukaryotic-like serine/threonine-protein kinase